MKSKANDILQEWNRETSARLCAGMQRLLEHVGDVLVDFASKAESNAIQSEFFDAQRELFLKSAYILPEFRSQLQGNQQTFSEQQTQLGAATLSLLDKDDYDLSVALDTIADRCTRRNQQNLHGLVQRLSAMAGGRNITPQQVPLNPHQVTQAFQRSSDSLEIKKRVQLVLFTLFDRYVVSLLDDAYTLINKRLAKAGVLPTLRYSISKNLREKAEARRTQTAHAAASAAPQEVELDDEVESVFIPNDQRRPPSTAESMLAIRNLLRARRHATGETPTSAQLQRTSVEQVNQVIDTPQVHSPVANVAANVLEAQGNKIIVDRQLMLKVRAALNKQRKMIEALIDQKKLTEREQDLIEIVGMLFEAILDDDNIPIAVKTLLSHLHTPYLKIAVNDPSFIQGHNHPARELLDQMLHLGVRWVMPQKLGQGIFPALQDCVRRILENPLQTDFAQLQEELEKREQQLRQSRTLTEKRTLEAEQGQAMLGQARDIAHSAVYTLLGERQLPGNVRVFLQTLFADYLSLLLLRNELNPRHPKCLQALDYCVQLIEKVGTGDNERAVAAAMPLTELILDLLPHYESQIEHFLEQLHGPLEAEDVPLEKADFLDPERPPEADEMAALELEPGTWLRWAPDGEDSHRAIKLIWTNPHTRNLLFVDQDGVKAAQMQASEVSRGLSQGTLTPLRKPKADNLLNGLLDGIRNRLNAD